jgi:hypothetical protein
VVGAGGAVVLLTRTVVCVTPEGCVCFCVCGAVVVVPAGLEVEVTRIVFVCPAAGVVPGAGAGAGLVPALDVPATGLGGTGVVVLGGTVVGLGGIGFPLTTASIRLDTCSTLSRTEFNLSTLLLILSMVIFWNHFFLAGGSAAVGAGVGAETGALGVGAVVSAAGWGIGGAACFAAGVGAVTSLGAPVAGWVEDGVLGFEAGTGAFTTGLGAPTC